MTYASTGALINSAIASNTCIGVSAPTLQCLTQDKRCLPQRAHRTDAGADLRSCEDLVIYPGETKLVDSGVAVKIPTNHAGLVYNRSSQGKRGITIPHSVGVIDSDYRGNIKVLLKNDGTEPYEIRAFDTRIAQLVITPVVICNFTDIWNDTQRGTGGYGSTG